MKRTTSFFGFALTTLALIGCAAHRAVITDAQDRLSVDRLTADITTLASDEFEGRRPGTPGGKKTIAFLKQRFRELGLEPGNGDSYLQEVPLIKDTPDTNAKLLVASDGEARELAFGKDILIRSGKLLELAALSESELVFVGFGIVAPEFGWDDYQGVDMQGKTAVILNNDPGYATGDTALFRGKGRTKYASSTHKFEEAARHGVAGAFVIYDTTLFASRRTWQRLKAGGVRPRIRLAPEGQVRPATVMEGYLNTDAAGGILAQAGLEYDSLLTVAVLPKFKSIPLDLLVSGTLQSEIERFPSFNVIGLLPGTERPDEVVIYTAHWDHAGRDTTREGDQIYNGAVDNASGTAALLTLAELFTGLEKRPERSILFTAVTAEESGLLGSRYYTEHPLYPMTKTAAVINVDILLPFGKTRDVIVIGLGKSQLDDYIKVAARRIGLSVQADMWPQEGFYYRSDHINFARKGIPSSLITTGVDNVANGQEWGLAQFDNYLKKTYHTPSDEYDDSWDIAGAVDVLRVLFDVGYTISNQRRFPNWYEGDEFRPVREAAVKAARNQGNNSR